eukprot:maker-scaffold_46-snap-gene-1.103-mRNA-1 protein AED:0.00 eAED:0.00 QI:117/1/1/1/1/1/2/101/297
MNILRSKLLRNDGKRVSTATIAWRNQTELDQRKQTMRDSILQNKINLASDETSILKSVFYPEDISKNDLDQEEIDEWVAENCIDFYNTIYLLYGLITEENHTWKIISEAKSGYPKGVTFYWKYKHQSEAIILPCDSYIKEIFNWLETQIEDNNIFPVDENIPFSKSFYKISRKIFSRILRIYLIIFSNDCLYKGKEIKHLVFSLRHFLYFGWYWDLLKQQEVDLIGRISRPIKKLYNKDKLALRLEKEKDAFSKSLQKLNNIKSNIGENESKTYEVNIQKTSSGRNKADSDLTFSDI